MGRLGYTKSISAPSERGKRTNQLPKHVAAASPRERDNAHLFLQEWLSSEQLGLVAKVGNPSGPVM